MAQNNFKSIAEELNEMMSYGRNEEENEMVFNSMEMNKNWTNMMNLANAILDDAMLYLPDEAVFEDYDNFVKDFDFEVHTELLADAFECWFEYGDNIAELNPALELYSKILYAIKCKVENDGWVFGDEEFSVIYNIYMRMLPHVPAKYLV